MSIVNYQLSIGFTGVVMPSTCPACNDSNIERLSTAYGEGGVEAEVAGDAAGAAPTVPPKAMSRRAAPPAKASYFRILIVWFVATFAAPFLVMMLQLPEAAGRYIPYGISILTAYALLRAYSYNKTQWPGLFKRWQHSYICLQCGKIFEKRW